MRPPVIDLQQLQEEVLSRGAEAALPCNLSDYWLNQITASLDQILEVCDEESGRYLSAPLALIVHLIVGKSSSKKGEIGEAELWKRFKNYRLELGLEEMSRCSDIKMTPATLATIFTDRNVKFSRMSEQ